MVIFVYISGEKNLQSILDCSDNLTFLLCRLKIALFVLGKVDIYFSAHGEFLSSSWIVQGRTTGTYLLSTENIPHLRMVV